MVGAQAFRRDVPSAEIHLLDSGHFALEEDLDMVVRHMKDFYAREVEGPRASQLAQTAPRSRTMVP